MLPDSCPPAQSIRVVNRSPLQVAGVTDAPGYGSRLATTPWGPASLHHWCVWIEPPDSEPPDRWEQRWSQAVNAALEHWSGVMSVQRVASPERAQVLLHRRKPPLRPVARGWRASNGRSRLQVIEVRRQQVWRFEPQVEVLVSPNLRAPVLQATALHELGHAFGLWGHSSDSVDAMAVHQGRQPVLRLSERDQQTLRWLRDQPNGYGPAPLHRSP